MFQVGCGGTFEYLLAVCRYGYFTVQVDQLVAQIEYQSPVTRRGIMFLELHFDAPVRIGLNRLIGYIVDLQGDRVVRNIHLVTFPSGVICPFGKVKVVKARTVPAVHLIVFPRHMLRMRVSYMLF